MNQKKITSIVFILIIIALPLLILVIKQSTQTRSNASAADKLEAESGTLGGNAVSKQDSMASGGSYVELSSSQTNTPTPNATANKIYGMGIAGDALSNTRLGGPYATNQQFMRFKAEHTSNLTSFRFYYIGPPDPGYAAGTGGTWSVGIYADDNSPDHLPTGSPLAPVTNVAAKTASNGDAGRLISLTTPVPLTAGKIYHLVFTNTDINPLDNYFSPDYWYYKDIPDRPAGSAPYPTQIHPLLPNSDWGHGYKIGNKWTLRDGHLPVLDLAYANGGHQGWSYAEASYNSVDEVGEINGASKMVREKIIVSGGNKTVIGAGIRVLKTSGNSALTITLENNSGVTIDSLSISASSFATGRAPDFTSPIDWDDLGAPAKWVNGNFSTPRTLTNGQIYYLRLSTTADTSYWAWVNRKLISYGYDKATYFSDGVAEFTRDGNTWAKLGRSKGDQDLQFYLTLQ